MLPPWHPKHLFNGLLGANERGALQVKLEEDSREYDPTLLEELHSRGFEFAPAPPQGQEMNQAKNEPGEE